MKYLTLFFLVGLLVTNTAPAQNLKAFQIYDKKGETILFSDMIQTLCLYDVILFGEYHNNAIVHWLELKTEKALYNKKQNDLIVGAEMFERDNQIILNKYLSDSIDAKQLIESARLWPNYKTDYKPLVDFAKNHHIKFIATNIPRNYASAVAKHGLNSLNKLSDSAKAFIASMPVKVNLKTPGYEEMKIILKKHTDSDNLINFIAAQAIKDATMAESILKNRQKNTLFLHFNGNYHSKSYGGIYWYLKKQKKWFQKLKIAVITIAISEQVNLPLPNNITKTEFNIVIPKDMTKTY